MATDKAYVCVYYLKDEGDPRYMRYTLVDYYMLLSLVQQYDVILLPCSNRALLGFVKEMLAPYLAAAPFPACLSPVRRV